MRFKSGCQRYETLQGEPGFPVTPVTGLFFPQLRAYSAESMAALLEGQLILEDGCLRVVTSYEPNSSLIIWQPDYFPTLNGVTETPAPREATRTPAN